MTESHLANALAEMRARTWKAERERAIWFAENSGAQAALARVRVLAAEWEQAAADGGARNYAASLFATAARDLRAALGDG